MKKVEIFILNLLLLLFIIFHARGPFYTENSLFSRLILVSFLGLSSFYLLKTLLLKNKKNSFYFYWLLLLFINIAGYFFTGDFSNPLHSSKFTSILIATLPFFPFYYFSKKGLLKEKHMLWLFIFLLPLIISKYYYNEIQILIERSYSLRGVTNNIGYYFASLIPFLFFFKRKRMLSYFFTFVLFFYIISSAKRGAIFVGVIGIICFLYYQLRSAQKKEFYITIVLVLLVTVILSYYSYEYIQNNEYLNARLEATLEGKSSGRDVIYSNIFDSWYNSDSIFNLIFGFGFVASLKFASGSYAHNDWLELLSNFGLIGVLIYSMLIYSLYSFIRSSKLSVNDKLFTAAILLMWIPTSFFSMVYNTPETAIQSLLLGYIIGYEGRKYNSV